MSKSRGFSWTLNLDMNKTRAVLMNEVLEISAILDRIECKYIVYQLETAPLTGQLHFQGYVYFETPRTLGGSKKRFAPYQPHLEVAKGSPQQNMTYCTKLETRCSIDGLFVVRIKDEDRGRVYVEWYEAG